ncbi:response regulator [Streptomyces sp. NPDC048248]|uniref:response regulator n=1 Tax=Streptomyces sp. NPDC048248 TaxID=3365523 RepID=UPI00370FAC2E
MTDPLLRVVLAEDSVILREGMVELLGARGCEVAATAGTPGELLAAVAEHRPDVAVVDVRMPPTFTDEGIRAAVELRATRPELGILVFSQHVETAWAERLLEAGAGGVGYLLKERVTRTSELVEALHRVAGGGTALDPEIVTRLMRGGRRRSRVESLTPRERETLELMAQGHSNRSIAGRLVVSERAVEKHVAAIFAKFGLSASETDNRRVKAVLAYLAETGGSAV